MSKQEEKFTGKKTDEVLENLMFFNQKILKDKDSLEGVIELSLHKGYKGRISASSFLAVPRSNVYQAFELLLKQGVGLFDADGSMTALGLSSDKVMMELFYNFMRIVTEKVVTSEQFRDLEKIEQENLQVREFIMNHFQALVSYGIVGADDNLDSEE